MLRSSTALSQVVHLIDLIAFDFYPVCPGDYILRIFMECIKCLNMKHSETGRKFESLSGHLCSNLGYR